MKDVLKKLKFELTNKDLKLKETLDKDFLELEMYVINNDKPNRNYSHFTEKSMYNSLDTFYNKPVLGYFNLKKDDFEEHNSDLEYDEDTEDLYWSYEAVDAEVPLGLIRESDVVEVVDKDNKKWIKLTCAIWVKYNREKVKKLLQDKKKKVSVEVQINEGHYEEVEGKGEIFFIDSFVFDGVTILGTERGSSTQKIEEGIEGAHLSILDLEENELFTKRKMALSFAYKKLDDYIHNKSNTDNSVIFIDKNSEEKEGEETLPNFTNIAEGYVLDNIQEDCAIFKKDEKAYSFSLKDVDCTQDIEFSEEKLTEVTLDEIVQELDIPAKVTGDDEIVQEAKCEVEETEEKCEDCEECGLAKEECAEEEECKQACEDECKQACEEECKEACEECTEAKEECIEEDKNEDKEDDEDDDHEEIDDDIDDGIDDSEKESVNQEEEFTVSEGALNTHAEGIPDNNVVDTFLNERVEALEAEKAQYVQKITDLEAQVAELQSVIAKANCEKMVEYANKLMEVRDLTEEEKQNIRDNCTKGIYADYAAIEKDIGYILFKKGAGLVETKKQSNFSVSIIQDKEDIEVDTNVFTRLKKIK